MGACKCDGRLGNTGDPNCPLIFDIASKLVITQMYANDGTANRIDLSALPFNSTFVSERINDPDASKRWYPTPGELKNVTNVRGETIYKTWNDQTKSFIRKGARAFTGMIPRVDPRLYSRFEEFRCVNGLGFYIIDTNGSLIGSKSDGEGTQYMYPIAISQDSFDAIFNLKTDEDVQNMMLALDVATAEKDGNLWMIPSDDFTGVNLLKIKGLYDVTGTVVGSVTTTGFTMKLQTAYDVLVEGLVIGDFFDEVGGAGSKVYNVTTDAAVTLTSVTESAPGEYTFVFTAQTSGDILRVTPIKTNFDFSEVSEVEVTIP